MQNKVGEGRRGMIFGTKEGKKGDYGGNLCIRYGLKTLTGFEDRGGIGGNRNCVAKVGEEENESDEG